MNATMPLRLFRRFRPVAVRLSALFLAIMLVAPCGCGAAFYMMNSEKKKPVAAECDKLAGSKVAVVVWAEPSTLDLDPGANFRTARQIGLVLEQNASKKELKGASYVDVMKVIQLQEQLGNVGPTLSNAEIGKRLGADVVLRVDLYQYTTRAPEAQGLIKGAVSGNIVVQRVDEATPIYRTDVSASFPEGSTIGVLDYSDEEVLAEALRRFGEAVARKFYAHEVAYE